MRGSRAANKKKDDPCIPKGTGRWTVHLRGPICPAG
jgi:hypothetical protein